MRKSEFTKSRSGALVRNLEGNWAFVPNPLPGRFQWNGELVTALSQADGALGRLVGISQNLRDPQRLLAKSFLRREAELSSRIEGTHATYADVVLFERTHSAEGRAPDVREVINNYEALRFGLESVGARGRPISLGLIREMHAVLMRGVRGADRTPGQFRTVQAHIGTTDQIGQARFVPAPPHHVLPAMEALEQYIRTPGELPTLVRAAMIHYQFEAIHPFADGNGRIGRVLILLLLSAEGALPIPLLNPSSFLEAHRREYYDHLLAVSQRGEWSQWLIFFLRAIAHEGREALARVERLRRLQSKYNDLFQRARSPALLLRLVDELFVTPAITLQTATRRLKVTPRSAQKIIEKLVGAGVLSEITGRRRNRVYMAKQILSAMQGKKSV